MWIIALITASIVVALYLIVIIIIVVTFKDFGKDPYGHE